MTSRLRVDEITNGGDAGPVDFPEGIKVLGTDLDLDDIVSRVDDTDLEAGYTLTAKNDGVKSSGTYTPSPSDSNIITITNNGAFTLAAPTTTGSYTIIISITNGSSAGAITLSGFTKVGGDDFTTTENDEFFVFITKIGNTTHAQVQDLQ